MPAIVYQPWYSGATFPSWDITLNTDTGPDDLTGVSASNFTMVFRSSGGTDMIGTGTFFIKSISPAEVLYKPSPADVASAFQGSLIIKCYFPPSNGVQDEVIYDPLPFVITVI